MPDWGKSLQARFVTLHGYDGYTANLPLRALLDDDVVIAHSVFGKPLAFEQGGPVPMVVPQRYAWKSVKWLKAIEFHDRDRPGFREQRGYHCRPVEGRTLCCRRRRTSRHYKKVRL